MRYWLFAFNQPADGGMDDFAGMFGSKEDAYKKIDYRFKYWQIADVHTGQVWKYKYSPEGIKDE